MNSNLVTGEFEIPLREIHSMCHQSIHFVTFKVVHVIYDVLFYFNHIIAVTFL